MRPRPAAPSVATALAAACAALAAPGCVERKMVLRTDPAGALVSLEDEPLGAATPVEVPFEFDGVRRVTLSAPGHQVLETQAALEARWHDYFPLDFVAEFLWPGTIEDVQVFEYRMEPFAVPIERPFTEDERTALRGRMDELTARAEEYRRGGSLGPGGTEAAAPGGAGPGAPAAPEVLPDVPTRRPPPRQARDIPPPTPPGQPLPPPVRPLPLVPPKEPEKK
jgi:hypothetical protein